MKMYKDFAGNKVKPIAQKTDKEERFPEETVKKMAKLCSGEWIGAFGLTEPGAGTDSQGQQTTAVLDEKGEN